LQTLLPLILEHTPAGASTKQFLHYGQGVVSGRFVHVFTLWVSEKENKTPIHISCTVSPTGCNITHIQKCKHNYKMYCSSCLQRTVSECEKCSLSEGKNTLTIFISDFWRRHPKFRIHNWTDHYYLVF